MYIYYKNNFISWLVLVLIFFIIRTFPVNISFKSKASLRFAACPFDIFTFWVGEGGSPILRKRCPSEYTWSYIEICASNHLKVQLGSTSVCACPIFNSSHCCCYIISSVATLSTECLSALCVDRWENLYTGVKSTYLRARFQFDALNYKKWCFW